MVLLLGCMQATFLIENPSSTLMFQFPLLRKAMNLLKDNAGMRVVDSACTQWLQHSCRRIPHSVLWSLDAQVYKVSFWMKHYKHQTYKRSTVLSNREEIARLDRGKLNRQITKCHLKTSVRYQDEKNRPCFKGSASLAQTQLLN